MTAKRKPRKPYVWHHRPDGQDWNGISYTGTEPGKVRMVFGPFPKRTGDKRRMLWAAMCVIRGARKSRRAHRRRKSLLLARKVFGGTWGMR